MKQEQQLNLEDVVQEATNAQMEKVLSSFVWSELFKECYFSISYDIYGFHFSIWFLLVADGQQPLHLFLSSTNAKSLEDAKLLAENLLDTICVECGASRYLILSCDGCRICGSWFVFPLEWNSNRAFCVFLRN